MKKRNPVILQYSDDTPIVASCECCLASFLASEEFLGQPFMAAENLWEKFQQHTCDQIVIAAEHLVFGRECTAYNLRDESQS